MYVQGILKNIIFVKISRPCWVPFDFIVYRGLDVKLTFFPLIFFHLFGLLKWDLHKNCYQATIPALYTRYSGNRHY